MINYNIEVENEYKNWQISNEQIIKIAQDILEFYRSCPEISKVYCLNNYDYKTLSFDILLCDGEKTHEINRDYRGKDYSADIITFALFADSTPEERFMQEFEINLGEVIIALDKICENAKEKQISRDMELAFMISHGIMHLLGFDHQTEEDFDFVVSYQKKALESIGIEYDKI